MYPLQYFRCEGLRGQALTACCPKLQFSDICQYTSSTVYAANYMGLIASGYSQPHLVDSLSISQIPEPSPIVLLVTGVLGLVARRRLRA